MYNTNIRGVDTHRYISKSQICSGQQVCKVQVKKPSKIHSETFHEIVRNIRLASVRLANIYVFTLYICNYWYIPISWSLSFTFFISLTAIRTSRALRLTQQQSTEILNWHYLLNQEKKFYLLNKILEKKTHMHSKFLRIFGQTQWHRNRKQL